MEKFLRFQDRNFDQVYYPLSKLRGFSRQDSVCGGCLFIHFDPLRNANESDAGSDVDVDYVKIKFTDASVLGTVIRNILTNISSSRTAIVDVLIIFGNAVQKHSFDIKGSNTSKYLCTPQTDAGEDQFGSAEAACAGVTWNDVITIHMASVV